MWGWDAVRSLSVKTLAALLLILAVAACAPAATWQNANVPQDEWKRDRDQCQAQALAQAEQDFALDQQTDQSANYNRGGQWAADMNRYSAQRREQQLFASCMTSRGYKLTPAESEGS